MPDDEHRQVPLADVSPGEVAPHAALGPSVSSGIDADALWPPELTRRLRVLLHTLPLGALSRGDSVRDPELRHYDTLALALRLLDIVVDRMGLEDEADREVVARVLEPLLVAMDQASGEPSRPDRHAAIIDKVLGHLRNEGDARRPFRQEYTSVGDDDRASRHVLEYRLLADAFHPSGRTVLRLSSEACNLYLRLLDLDIEDAHAAAEAVVESQLARGRFEEAVYSARQARVQSVRFREKVMRIIQETRRDMDRVDWREEVPSLLDDARAHLKRRLQAEQGILDTADERLDILPEEDVESRRAVAQVAAVIRECRLRHHELHAQLMRARNVFLDAQAQQAFGAAPARLLPELRDQVLEPLLRMPVAEVGGIVDQGFPLFVGARPPVMPSLAGLVTWMLQPRRPRPRQEVPVDAVDPSAPHTELARYSPALRAAAADLVSRIDAPIPLSALLERARAQGGDDALIEFLALRALQGFASEDRPAAGVQAEVMAGKALIDPMLHGDELLLLPMGKDTDGSPR